MQSKLLGVPLVVWGGLCTLLTIVWVFVWPSEKVIPGNFLNFFILRWFHALTWLFLALAALIAAFKQEGGRLLARRVAFLSLIAYLVFMFTFVTS